MNNHHEHTHVIDPQEYDMENNDIDQDEFHDETNDDLIPDKEPDHISPYLDNNFSSQTMNSGIMTIHHNDPEHIIDYPEDFLQCHSWLLSGKRENFIQQPSQLTLNNYM